jgi:hypothetical protein
MATLTELEDLRLFLQERVQEFDPSLDTETGSSFDSNVIQPLLSRLGPDPYDTPIRDFIIGRLQREFPDLVVQDGEPIDDYAVKIMQILLTPFRRQIQQISVNQSLAEPETLNEAEADNLAGNFYARRQAGGFSVGVARLYFSSPQFILVTPSNPVSSGDGLNFYPVENQSITADNMLFNTEDNLFYFDVAVRAAAEGQEYNIAPNMLVSVEGIPSAVKVVNQLAFEEGAGKETTEEFIERVENSLSEKSLVTLRGISAKLRDVFENIRIIQVIGYGDPEMERDVITGGGEAQTYAVFLGDTPDTSGLGTPTINLNTLQLTDGVAGHDDFSDAVVAVGDVVTLVDISGQTLSDHTVTAVESSTELSVTPNVTDDLSSSYFMLRRALGGINISDIPGGILQPITDAGEIPITDNQVHIGGALDVFIRAGAPQEQSSTLDGVLDGSPLIFGVDLESYGEGDDDVFVHVTEKISGHIAIPGLDRFGAALATNDNLVVRQYYNPGGGGPYAPWVPTEADVGRYVQLLGGGTPGEWGTFRIEEILQEEYLLTYRAVRIRVSTLDEETGVDSGGFTTDNSFDTDFRLVEKVSVTSRVRDRNGSRVAITGGSGDILAGRDFLAEGAAIGDSVVIETADDAGIYSIRRILTWVDANDTLILDRDLTRKVKPSGSGDGSGLRYRVADDLNIDLVDPRVTKMPLGAIFTADDLSTVAGLETVTAVGGDSNFLLAGVEEGDSLEILEGDDEGTYEIQSVSGTTLTLDVAMRNTASGVSFTTFRPLDGVSLPLVRVESVELLDSNSQPTGIQIPYGDSIDARVKGQFSNRAEGNVLESYTAETKAGTGGKLVLLEDVNKDFVASGIVPGYRLVLYSVPNSGNYIIKSVGTGDGLANDNQIEVELAADGGTEFRTATTGVHYSIGLPSAGFARLYFQEPTTVEISTGLAGGRLQHIASGATREYMFSSADGRVLIPAGGSEDEVPRDLRVVSSSETSPGSGEYLTIAELSDETRPGVFELELQEGDVFEVFEQVPFRTTAGDTFAEAGVFGKAAGLRTISGSNLVSIPSNSLIDFTAMDTVLPLVGQALRIDSGPDAGEYVIEAVVSAKSLRLSTVMTATTESIAGQEVATPRDATLADSGSKTSITDTTDGAALGAQAGHFITIFESLRGDIDGTYEISDPDIGANAVEIDTSFDTPAGSPQDPLSVGDFSWVRTVLDTNVSQEFRIYNTLPTEVAVTQVATKRADVVGLEYGDITSSTEFDDASGVNFVTEGVEQGDLLEIVSEAGVGVYYIASVAASQLTIQASKPFTSAVSDQPYRIWGGLHGSRRMVTLGKFGGSTGKLEVGSMTPYRVKRPDVYRVSSTEMSENYDGTLYYTDIQIESLGAGDELNLERGERLLVQSGLRVDGYTYSVENNNLTFSPFEEVSLTFDRRFLPVGNSDSPENLTEISGRNIKISYETSTTVRLVHDLMRSEAERPINANPMARHFLPSYVYVRLQYGGGVTAAEVGPDIEDYINNLGAGAELEVSDLEAFLTRRGADSVSHPIEIVVVTHDLDRNLIVDRTENKLGGGSTVPYNGTGRISSFFTTLGESLLVERES